MTFYCNGEVEETPPKFHAMLDDLKTLLNAKHPAISAPELGGELTNDEVNEYPDCDADFEDEEAGKDSHEEKDN